MTNKLPKYTMATDGAYIHVDITKYVGPIYDNNYTGQMQIGYLSLNIGMNRTAGDSPISHKDEIIAKLMIKIDELEELIPKLPVGNASFMRDPAKVVRETHNKTICMNHHTGKLNIPTENLDPEYSRLVDENFHELTDPICPKASVKTFICTLKAFPGKHRIESNEDGTYTRINTIVKESDYIEFGDAEAYFSELYNMGPIKSTDILEFIKTTEL